MSSQNGDVTELFMLGLNVLLGLLILQVARDKVCVSKVRGVPYLSAYQIAVGFTIVVVLTYIVSHFMTAGRTISNNIKMAGDSMLAWVVYAICLVILYSSVVVLMRSSLVLYAAFNCSGVSFTETMSKEDMYKCRWIIQSYYKISENTYRVAFRIKVHSVDSCEVEAMLSGILSLAPSDPLRSSITAITYIVYIWCKTHNVVYRIWYNPRHLLLAFKFEDRVYALTFGKEVAAYRATSIESLWPANAHKFNQEAIIAILCGEQWVPILHEINKE